jgi:predicted nucleic acid-binding protein
MKLAYIDSCVWISWVEGLTDYQGKIGDAMRQLSQDGWTFCISDAVVLEVMVNPLKRQQNHLVEAYRKIFERTRNIKTHMGLFKEALSVAYTENLRAMDAIHVAIASHHGCERFVTTDPHFRYLKLIQSHWINLVE